MAEHSRNAQGKIPIRAAVLIFLFLNFTYLLTSTGRVHTIDEISTVMQAESLARRGSTAIPQAVGSGIYYGKADVHGQPHSPYPPGHPIAIVPWYLAGAKVIAPLLHVPRENLDLVLSMVATWSSATFAAVAVALAFLLVWSMRISEREAMIVAAALAFASPLFVYSGWLFSEPLTTSLWIGAALALFGAPVSVAISAKRAVVAGVLLGCSLYVRPTNAIAAGLFLVAFWLRSRTGAWRAISIVAAVVAAFGVSYLARNAQLYGSFADFGYPSVAEGGRELNTFHTPFLVGLTGFLFSPGKSMFLFFPPVILALGMLPRLWKRDRGLAFVCGATPATYILFYAQYSQWEGIYSWGPRYLVPPIVLLGVALSVGFSEGPKWFTKAFTALVAVGFVIQLIGLSTNIVEDMVRNHYYYGNWQYRWSYSAITGQMGLIAKYLGGAPAPLGYGFDRWFLFLRKSGASTAAVWGLALTMLAGIAASGWLLLREWRLAGRSDGL
jgi:hypothetical protein